MESRSRKSEVGCQRMGIRNKMPEIRSQKTDRINKSIETRGKRHGHFMSRTSCRRCFPFLTSCFSTLISSFLLLASCLPSSARADSPTAIDIVKNIQENYKKTNDAVIKFIQTVTYPLSKLTKTTSGTLYLKKDNKYKIDTGDKIIVTDGKTSWIYIAASNQVLIDKFRDDKNTVTPNRFLLDVPANYFAVLLSANKNGGETTYTLRLTPKSDNSFIRGITILVNSDWTIRSADVTDMNDTEYKYEVDHIKFNSGLPDSEFEFVPPKGTQIVDLRNK